jgi:hypothetical protein
VTPIFTRRSILLAGAAAGVGCLRLPEADSPAGGPSAPTYGAWTTAFFGTPPTKILVWRMTGNLTGHRKLKGFFVKVDETGSFVGRMGRALQSCGASEYYQARSFEEILVIRDVAAGLEPWMFGRANSGLTCRTGPDCQSQWNLVGRAPSGVAHYRYYQPAPTGSVFVLPDRTWVYAMGSCEIRLANAFAANAAAPPRCDVEPAAVIAQWLRPREEGWQELAEWIAPFAGAETITGAVTATFTPVGDGVPALVRWLLPDAGRAAAGAADFRALLDGERARLGRASDPQRPDRLPSVAAEGASIALRSWVTREAVAAYIA